MKKLFLLMILFVLAGVVGRVNAGILTNQDQRPPVPERPFEPENYPLTLAQQETRFGEACVGENLLQNPGFEGQYTGYVPPGGHPDCPAGICATAQMAPNWTPWWRSHDNNDEGWIYLNPEYKPADPIFTNPPRVRSGAASQQYFTFYATHRAGFYQQVPVTAGETYRFCIWGHSWSAQDDDDALSGPDDGELNQKIGIDPTGGTTWPTHDGTAPNIVWGGERRQYDEFGLFDVTVTAQSNTITVYVFSEPDYAVKHNDVYWDDAVLVSTAIPDPIMHINPDNGVVFLAETGNTNNQTQQVNISFENDLGVGWSVFDNGGSVVPTLNPLTGVAANPLNVTVNAGGFTAGSFTTNLTITASDPATVNSPRNLEVKLVVADELQRIYLPIIAAP